MSPNSNHASLPGGTRRLGALMLALSVLLAGVLYYALYRQHAMPSFLTWMPLLKSSATPFMANGLFGQSVPSLAHAFASVLLMHALLPSASEDRQRMRIAMIGALLGFEFLWGTVDGWDLLAILLGSLLAELIAWRFNLVVHTHSQVNRWALTGLVTVSALMAAGSGPYEYRECARYDTAGQCEEYKKPGTPIYTSYQRLRESVQFEAARAPDRLGRMYLYQDFVFLNERNEGIHVIDNHDPEAPINVGFIRIPGNTELAIRGNYLYADSYVDLITLDLNDPANVQLINRQEDVFPYDPFQNIPYNISLRGSDTDPVRGVIVGYVLK